MKSRINPAQVAPAAYNTMFGLEKYLHSSSIEPNLLHLLKLRASQINGCAYCIDMHWKDLRALGETEQRLYGLDAWEESPYYTERERAAFEWLESLTLITEGHVPDELFERTRKVFSEQEIVDLSMAAVTINAWNRLSIAFRAEPGTYKSQLRPTTHEAKSA
jgi:AhpD family alkylhydroperoxidase